MAIQVYMYDPHTWEGERLFGVYTDRRRYSIRVMENLERPRSNGLVLIADELCGTKFPYFFPRASRVALLKESPIYSNMLDVEDLKSKFDLVLTHQKNLIERGPPFTRVEYSANWVERDPGYSRAIKKDKLVSFIYNSLNTSREQGYVFRTKIYETIKNRSGLEIYGRGVGEIEYKTIGLNRFRFSIAMENYRSDYYFTEKLIDCFMTETIPIYWGCPSINEIFDERGILSFSTLEELLKILDAIDEKEYEKRKPFALENRRRCEELMLRSFHDYFTRCLKEMEISGKIDSGKLNPIVTSKPLAGLRYGLDRIRRM